MISVIKLEENHIPMLERFCQECKLLGYTNNDSIKSMKFGDVYDLGEIPKFFAVVVDDEIAAVSGMHSLSDTSIRCSFRGCMLPKFNNLLKGISKTHMNSLPHSLLLPEQLLEGLEKGYENFYITTSNSHDASGRMNRTHKALQLLEKQKIVEYSGTEILYHVPQYLWKINLDKIFKSFKSFDIIKQKLNIIPYKFNLGNPFIAKHLAGNTI